MTLSISMWMVNTKRVGQDLIHGHFIARPSLHERIRLLGNIQRISMVPDDWIKLVSMRYTWFRLQGR